MKARLQCAGAQRGRAAPARRSRFRRSRAGAAASMAAGQEPPSARAALIGCDADGGFSGGAEVPGRGADITGCRDGGGEWIVIFIK
jgi:hypothetical protein